MGDPIRRDKSAHRLDTDCDALGRTSIYVEQASPDHLLGSECDVNVGPVGIGVELDPAGTIAWRKGDSARMVMSGRYGACGINQKPARVVAACLADCRGCRFRIPLDAAPAV